MDTIRSLILENGPGTFDDRFIPMGDLPGTFDDRTRGDDTIDGLSTQAGTGAGA